MKGVIPGKKLKASVVAQDIGYSIAINQRGESLQTALFEDHMLRVMWKGEFGNKRHLRIFEREIEREALPGKDSCAVGTQRSSGTQKNRVSRK